MKKIFILISLIICLSIFTGCINISIKSPDENSEIVQDEKDDFTSEEEHDENDIIDSENEDEPTKEDNKQDNSEDDNSQKKNENDEKNDVQSNNSTARVGTVNNPIKKGETGIIVIDNYTSKKPEKIYITLKEVLSEKDAIKLIDEYESNSYTSFSTETSVEKYVAKFSVDLKEYTTSKYGKTIRTLIPSGVIRNSKGETIKDSKNLYFLPTFSIGIPSDPHKTALSGEIVDCYVVFSIPKGYKDGYLLEFEDKDNDTVYFTLK